MYEHAFSSFHAIAAHFAAAFGGAVSLLAISCFVVRLLRDRLGERYEALCKLLYPTLNVMLFLELVSILAASVAALIDFQKVEALFASPIIRDKGLFIVLAFETYTFMYYLTLKYGERLVDSMPVATYMLALGIISGVLIVLIAGLGGHLSYGESLIDFIFDKLGIPPPWSP
ncbi:hypothetical protein [Candidatus Methanodesulfokora washburnensis]|jgi:hypothetical protein|uniref:Uncharacterized protein n=1 Tax=Candidatus Methanodesulfokora washburnensis TaxID=2478471 RepID=A0A3R9PSQ2_9CREN|nr:hypothetical protein [Candidatus Methanodesulfokores washburnensis]RSN71731.1 hypothetical protein D6D85_15470 [Candidatus Methanodesulfokores washburnensis]